jgi:hypothetical protein
MYYQGLFEKAWGEVAFVFARMTSKETCQRELD